VRAKTNSSASPLLAAAANAWRSMVQRVSPLPAYVALDMVMDEGSASGARRYDSYSLPQPTG
jgi:hypothetical protein